jgi:hypothetical protein
MKKIRSWSYFCKSSGTRKVPTSSSNSDAKTSDIVVSRSFKIPLLGELRVGRSVVSFGDWQRSIVAVDVGRLRLALSSDRDTTRDTNRIYVRSWKADLKVTKRKRRRN